MAPETSTTYGKAPSSAHSCKHRSETPCSCNRCTATTESTSPLFLGSASCKHLCNSRNCARLFSDPSCLATPSISTCSAAPRSRPLTVCRGSSASPSDINQGCRRACEGRGRWARSRCSIIASSSLRRGRVQGKWSQGRDIRWATELHCTGSPKPAIEPLGASTPLAPPCLLGTLAITSWKKTIPRLNTSLRGYQSPSCHVSGGM
mmetsp:Transcript_53507/g.174140  ORF Transcript_53507/g.174140 Transcript_53507/m.174140 type:complete len:205 (-) Transcript_53507:1113-1727(-)